MKTIGYYLFALIYNIYRVFPIKANKVLCIMTHDDGAASNVNIVAKALEEGPNQYSFAYITKTDKDKVTTFRSLLTIFKFFFVKPYDLATSSLVLMDNTFLPFAYIKNRKGQKVIQLWHGTGSIKRFGQDVNKGRLKELERRANENITHLIVNSEQMKALYARLFGISLDKIYPIGIPKTDDLLRRCSANSLQTTSIDRINIFDKYNINYDKKLILYCPTFREDDLQSIKIYKHIKEIGDKLPQGYILGLRLHPFVAKSFDDRDILKSVVQMSYEKDLNASLMAADILMTDYSSITYDYCVTRKPIIFFPYDLDEFLKDGRGIFMDFEEFAPGPIGYISQEILDIIINESYKDEYYKEKLEVFLEENYMYLDGKATERLINLIG